MDLRFTVQSLGFLRVTSAKNLLISPRTSNNCFLDDSNGGEVRGEEVAVSVVRKSRSRVKRRRSFFGIT